MLNRQVYILVVTAAYLSTLPTVSTAADGTASIKLGYTFISDTGSLGLNQETYNSYEGFGVSVQNLRYAFDNGMILGSELRNVSLNNRNVRATLGKPGRFSLSVSNAQYRRVYTFDGSTFTRRSQTGVMASYQPSRYFKFFGGYNLNDKHGESASILAYTLDTIITSTDYKQTGYNVGAQIGDRYGVLRFDYRHSLFDDRLLADADRKSDKFAVSISSSIPRLKRVFVGAGYTYRKDTAQSWESSLRTNELWGALKAGFSGGLLAEYRVMYDMTKHVGFLRETDNITHTFALGKNWGRSGGIQGGYEKHIADDFINKTTSNGFTANGWYRPNEKWSFAARVSTRDKDINEGATLTGAESLVRNRVSASYTDTSWGYFAVKWQSRSRTSDDLNSKVDYRSLTPELNLKLKQFGRLTASYSYATGSFENMSTAIGYEFLDHLVSGTLYLPTWKKITVDVGGTYYRSTRSQDLEKTRLNFGALYTVQKGYHIEVRYNVFNYDNFLVNNSYYTGNIVEINFIKDISF